MYYISKDRARRALSNTCTRDSIGPTYPHDKFKIHDFCKFMIVPINCAQKYIHNHLFSIIFSTLLLFQIPSRPYDAGFRRGGQSIHRISYHKRSFLSLSFHNVSQSDKSFLYRRSSSFFFKKDHTFSIGFKSGE